MKGSNRILGSQNISKKWGDFKDSKHLPPPQNMAWTHQKKKQHSTREYIQYVVRWCGVIFGIDLFLVVCWMFFYFKQIIGEMGGGHPIPNFDILVGCNWVVAPKNSTPSEDVPFKDDFLVYHKHIFTKVCHGVADCVDKPPAEMSCRSICSRWIWRFDTAGSPWWKNVCSVVICLFIFISLILVVS